MLETFKLTRKYYINFPFDSIFNNHIFAKYITNLLKQGFKIKAEQFMYKLVYLFKFAFKYLNMEAVLQNFLSVLYKPYKILFKRVGSNIHKVPLIANFPSSVSLTTQQFKAKPNKFKFVLMQKVAALLYRGAFFKGHLQSNQLVRANKKYAHYRW